MYVIIESAGLTGGAGSSPVDQVLLPFHLLLNSHLIIITCSELWKVLFLAPSVCGFLFVYEISWGTAERICAKFTQKTFSPLLRRVCRSKVKVTIDKKRHFLAILAACMQFVFGKTSLAFSMFLYYHQHWTEYIVMCHCDV